jgi:hypothetical protein
VEEVHELLHLEVSSQLAALDGTVHHYVDQAQERYLCNACVPNLRGVAHSGASRGG